MTSQEAFEEQYGMAAESNQLRFVDFDAGWQASRAAFAAEGWLRAIDEELVGGHIGVANATDGYAVAKKKLNDLICRSIQVVTDPAVNGGKVLVKAANLIACRNALLYRDIYEAYYQLYTSVDWADPYNPWR